ncbi:MAG: hypothetical protein NVS1B1_08390 [Candidatus Limnocylindrales bacterium]
MDAALVRAFLAAAEERPPDQAGAARVRAGLEILGRPDIRYLVATVRGPGAPTIARYTRAILEAAGATVGRPGDPIDDELFAAAGTEAASAGYSLGASRPELGEPTRAELTLLLELTALAAANRRVVLLVDPDPVGSPTLFDALAADVSVLSGPEDDVTLALGAAPAGRPVVVLPPDPSLAVSTDRLDMVGAERGPAILRAGREFTLERCDGFIAVTVAGETYGDLPVPAGDDPWHLATGVATALAVGLLGVRMRPEWIARGVRVAAAE